ncbi:MAG: hypothetical protein J6W76_06480 [Spirochaetales bacterium]|nr:hypothetical protein [Spirochaetales bacterium]
MKKVLLLLFFTFGSLAAFCQNEPTASKPLLICHAFGSVDSHAYTNSREAFMANYRAGMRYFEVDFALSRDGQLICFHPGEGGRLSKPTEDVSVFTAREYAKIRIDEHYHTMDIDEVQRLMIHYPDMYIVTDTKGWSQELVDAFTASVFKTRYDVHRRIILQIYRPSDYDLIAPMFRYFTFGGIIYTLYQLDISYQEVLDFVRDKNILAIAVETERLRKRQSTILWLKSHGMNVYVFTVNDQEWLDRVYKLGLDGVYTDVLLK